MDPWNVTYRTVRDSGEPNLADLLMAALWRDAHGVRRRFDAMKGSR
jgi:hypothetical protein